MTARKALVIEEAYLHSEDAQDVDDVTVLVGEDCVNITTKHGNAITLDFEDLAAINQMVNESKRPKIRTSGGWNRTGMVILEQVVGQQISNAIENAVSAQRATAIGGVSLSTAARNLTVNLQRAEEAIAQKIQSWQPDWDKIDPEIKFIAKDENGHVWGYTNKSTKNESFAHWSSPSSEERRLHLLDGKIPGDWKVLYERPVQGELAFLGLNWAGVPAEYNYVAADRDKTVWGFRKCPHINITDDYWIAGDSVLGDRLGQAQRVDDWKDSLRIRPGFMTDILGITWADVPEEYHYVAADDGGFVFAYSTYRPHISGSCWWSAIGVSVTCAPLGRATLPANLSWRNTLFVRPGYTEPAPLGI